MNREAFLRGYLEKTAGAVNKPWELIDDFDESLKAWGEQFEHLIAKNKAIEEGRVPPPDPVWSPEVQAELEAYEKARLARLAEKRKKEANAIAGGSLHTDLPRK